MLFSFWRKSAIIAGSVCFTLSAMVVCRPFDASAAAPDSVVADAVSSDYATISWALENPSETPFMVVSTAANFSVWISSAEGYAGQQTAVYPLTYSNTRHYFKVKVSTEPDANYSAPISFLPPFPPPVVYFNDISTTSLAPSAYAPPPHFANLDIGSAGMNIAMDGTYAGWWSGNRWVTKAVMTTARYNHAAVAVSGKIYVVGGWDGGSTFNKNEEYDPAANSWATKAVMPTARYALAAAAVDGKIYAIGGTGGLNVNQEYDPVSNTWAAKAVMPTARYALAAAAVDGKIYAIGGYTTVDVATNEEYNPVANVWATKTSMPTARRSHAAVALRGRIYAIGGYPALAANEEYDPASNTWAAKAVMPTARYALAAAAVGGKIYAMGGWTSTHVKINEEYDPAANIWANRADMITAHSYPAAVASGGRIYFIGGSGGVFNENQEYDPGTAYNFTGLIPNTQYSFKAKARNSDSVETAESQEVSTYTLAAVAGPQGVSTFTAVYTSSLTVNWSSGTTAGGYNAPGAQYLVEASSMSSFIYIAASSLTYNTWADIKDLGGNTTNYYFRVKAANNIGSWGNTLALGTAAVTGAIETPTTIYFDEVSTTAITAAAYAPAPAFSRLETGSSGMNIARDTVYAGWWSGNRWVTKAVMTTARYGLAAAAVNGRIYALGGATNLTTNEEYNPAANTWATKAVMPTGNQYLAAAAVGGRIYAIGGAGTTNANQEYDPVTNTWSTKAVMPTGRAGLAAAAVNGRIYAIGGVTNLTTNEEYDPAANTWAAKTAMPTGRQYLAAAGVNGKIYALGGTGGTNVNEAYDPVANTWATKAVMNTSRYGLGAAVLGGKIYAIGGYIAAATNVNEEYDPAVDMWTTRVPMPTARTALAVVAVSSRIYAIGGDATLDNVTEEYDPGTAYRFAGLVPNTQYTFKAMARNYSAVETPESPAVSTYTLAAVAGAQDVSTFTAVFVSSLTVNWSSGTASGGYSAPGALYLVQASVYSTTFLPVAASSLTYNIWAGLEGLAGSSTYYFRVKAANNIGSWGDYLILGSTAITAIEAPTGIYFDEISTTAITASAYAPTPAFSNLHIGSSGINIAKDGVYAGWWSGNRWATKAVMTTARYGLAAAVVNGKIYAIGGFASTPVNQEYNPAANSWTTKTVMTTGRHCLGVAAAGGRIYAIGGVGGTNVNEEYDPLSNTWTTKTVMPTARSYFAVAATGGRIYAIGGIGSLAANEEYNPVTNSWAAKTGMITPRGYLAAAAVNDRIYAIGGIESAKNANEEYNPATNTWAIKRAMPTGRQELTTVVVGGKVYALGGYTTVSVSTNEEYDPAADAWTARPNMPTARYSFAGAAVAGRIYAIGGYSAVTTDINEEYDPGTAQSFPGLIPNTQYTFKARARSSLGVETAESPEVSTYTLAAVAGAQDISTFTAVYASSLTVNWSSGTASGGYNAPGAQYLVEASVSSTTSGPVAASSQTYNIWAGLDGLTGNVTYYFRVKPANNLGVWGDYLVLGSTVIGSIETPTAVYFDEVSTISITAAAYAATPGFTNLTVGASGMNIAKDGEYAGWWSGNKWVTKAVMTTARSGLAAAAVNGRIYALGGVTNLTTNEEYNPAANTWATKAVMPIGNQYLAAAAVGGRIYAIGGANSTSANQEYDPVSNTWSTKAAMPTGRAGLAAAAVNGRIYAIGGVTSLTTNEEYNPAANTWAAKTAIPTGRQYLAAAALNGKIYAVGGLNGLNVNEAYDPVANTWATKAVMNTSRYGLGAAVLGGKIYAIGGYIAAATNVNEEYDPAVDIWTTRVPMPTARYYLATVAVSSRIYAIGGDAALDNVTEEYDPGTASVFAGLIPNTQYTFKAKARNANGVETPESPSFSTYTLAAVAVAQDVSIFTSVYVSSLTVNWSSGTLAAGYNGPGALYQAEASVSSTTFSPVAASSQTYNIWAGLEGLSGSVTYYFRVKPANNLGVWNDYFVLGSTVIGSIETPTAVYFDEVSTISITAAAYAATPGFTNLNVGASGMNIAKDGEYAGWWSGNRWVTKAVMTTARSGLAAAAVNGRIYALGGVTNLTTNEEYNPAANTWTTKAVMPIGNQYLAAAAVGGRIYAIGGANSTSANQEYDPVSNTWSTKAAMPTGRAGLAAAAVNGRIYAIGGVTSLTTNEEYNPAANTWAAKTAMPTGRQYLAAAALNGKIYAVGGLNGLNVNEAYDPVANTWATKAVMNTSRYGLGAAVLGGKIYAIGGYIAAAANVNEEYDPAVDIWTTRVPMPTARYYLATVAVSSRIYAIGGDAALDNVTEEYDPGTASVFAGLIPNTQYTFKAKARNANGVETPESPSFSTYTLAAVAVAQDVSIFTSVYVSSLTVNWSSGTLAAGYNGPGALYRVEASISSTTFSPIASSSQTYNLWGELDGLNGNVTYYFRVKPANNLGVWNDYLVLGSTVMGSIETPTAVYFDEVSTTSITAAAYAATPGFTNLNVGASGMNIAKDGEYAGWWSGNRWATKEVMTTARYGLAAAAVNGRIYAIGGYSGGNSAANQEYNPVSNTWAAKTAMPTARTDLAAAAVGAKIYALGGAGGLTLNEEYDTIVNAWAAKTVMPTSRAYLAAAAVNGKVYAIGGGGPLTTNEEYNPATGAWATRTAMPTARYGLAAVSVNGKIYAIGGDSADPDNKTEEYDPAANTWATKAVMPTGRYQLAGGVVGGKIYAIGGYTSAAANTNEEYDPAIDAWTSRPAMLTARYKLAVAAAGGKIYAIGGDSVDPDNKTEEYDPGTTSVFAGLIPNKQYTFKAKARNANGVETPESPSFSTYTLAAVAVAQDVSIFTSVYVSSLTVNWSSGTLAAGYNGPGALYRVEASVSSTTFSPIASSSQTHNLWGELDGLNGNVTYYFRVKPANNLGVWNDYLVLGSTVMGSIETPTAVYFDEVSTISITAAAYAATPGFTNLTVGASGINIAKDGAYAGWWSGNKWVTKAVMTTARYGLAAAAVNGRIYAIGGYSGGNSAANQEYNPVSNTWAAKTAMPTARTDLAAAAVGAKIYALGGAGGLTLNEEYDTIANAWAAKTVMPTSRLSLAAAAVNGKVYAIGGGGPLTANEEYNPATGTWATRTAMPTARYGLAAVSVNGKIYAIGGDSADPDNKTEEYDPAANTWAVKAAMPTGRYKLAAGVVGGKIYAIGGYTSAAANTNEEYDPAIDAWTSRPAMPTARNGLAVAAAGGKIYAIGGDSVDPDNKNEEYDPGTASVFAGLIPNTQYTFKAKARNANGVETPESPSFSTYTLAAVAQDVSIFTSVYVSSLTVNWSSGTLAAGYNGPGALYQVEAATAAVFTSITASSLTYNIWGGLEGLTGNVTYYFRVKPANSLGVWGDYLALGSIGMGSVETPTDIYFEEISTVSITAVAYALPPAFTNLDIGSSGINIARDGAYAGWWSGNMWATKTMMTTARYAHAVAVVGGRIYTIGGYVGGSSNINEEYNPVADAWTTKTPMTTARQYLAAAAVGGKIYAVGGHTTIWTGVNEEYDPVANNWAAKMAMITGRRYLAAAALNGRVYALGGYHGTGSDNHNEEYSPVYNTWAAKAVMPTARQYLAAAASGGRIYAMGGDSSNINEEYNPLTNTWATKAVMPTGRSSFAAAAMGGKIYAMGGTTGNQKQNQEYDPAANTWVSRADMPTARYDLAAAAVSGRIYAIGGYGGTQKENQEYDPGTAYKFTGLAPNTQYSFKAKARNANGFETPESPVVSTYTLVTVAGPQDISTFTAVFVSSLTVNWSSGTAAGGYNGPGARYLVEVATASVFSTITISSLTYNIWAGLEGLPANATSYFRVKAANVPGIWGDYLVLGSTAIGSIETPTGIYFDEISTFSITASAYAPTPAFSNLNIGASGINVARDGSYAGWRNGNIWTTKAVITTARYYPVAAVVSGRIYVIGGSAGTNKENEEYNPVANTWAAKAVMPTSRYYLAAAAAGGKIYALGGTSGTNVNEEYDPVANTWATKAVMPTARQNHVAASVNGKIYVIGGYGPLSTNEEYDPVANIWSAKAAMPTARQYHAAEVVGTRIYVIGAGTANEEYDPLTNTWAVKAAMPTSRTWHAAASAGGKIYIIGGQGGQNVNEEYDPAADAWAARAVMPTPRYSNAAAAVNGRIYSMGGYGGTSANEQYDPGVTFQFAGLIPNTQYSFKAKARNAYGAETLESPEVSTYTLAAVSGPQDVSTFTAVFISSLTVNWSSGSVTGGYNGAGASYLVQASVSSTTFNPVISSSLTYNISAVMDGLTGSVTYYFRVKAANNLGVWGDYLLLGSTVMAGAMGTPTGIYFDEISTTAITASAYAPTPAFANLEVGSSGMNIAKDSVYAGWWSGNRWTGKTAMTTARYGLAAAAVNGRIYAIGGYTTGIVATNEVYDPVANSWATKASMPTARYYLAAATSGGRIYAIGGSGGLSNENQEYDPVANTWSAKAAKPIGMYYHTATAAGGRIYAIGGSGGNQRNNEEYNPVADTWTTKALMPTGRYAHVAAAVNGRIYAIGGTGGTNVNEEYDPVADVWASKAVMTTGRDYLAAGAVGGKIYAIGGTGGPTANQEYDPAVNIWATRANMTTGRSSLAAAASGGRIYALGGSGPLATNEEYDPGTAYAFTGLTPNTQYAFKAKARDSAGTETAESPALSTYTLAAVAGPQDVSTFTAVYISSLTVNWSSGTAVGGYNAPGALYFVQASMSSTTFAPVMASSLTYNISADLAGLTGCGTYYFRIKAANNIGAWGDYLVLGSTVISAVETPTVIYFSDISSFSITAAAYAPTPAFSGLNLGSSGINVALDGSYAGWRNGNVWATKTGMNTGRGYLAAAAINGRVYAVGGFSTLGTTEEYNPVSNAWVTKAVMPTGRDYLAAAAAGGKLYAIGGRGSSYTENQEYDPVANTWASKGSMPTARQYLAAAAANGRIYVMGGRYFGGGFTTNEEFNPLTNAWATKAPMSVGRSELAAAAVGGKIYVIGSLEATTANEEYDTASNTWATKAPMPTGRSSLSAAAAGGKVYAIGGTGGTNVNEEYDPAADTWVARANLPTARYALAAAATGDGRIYAVGGAGSYATNEEYDSGTVSTFTGLSPNTQYFFKAKARNADGVETAESPVFSTYTLVTVAGAQGVSTFTAVFVSSLTVNWSSGTAAGGYNGPGALYQLEAATTTVFTTVTASSSTYNIWAGLEGLTGNVTYYFRVKAESTNGIWGDYLVLGSTAMGSIEAPTNIYFDEVSSFSITAAAYTPTPGFTNLGFGSSGMNIAKDGVYAGWWSGDRWATKAVMTTARYYLAAAVVSGRIYAIGGYNSGARSENEEYNPAANAWVVKTVMPTARYHPAAAAVSGKVYAIGGFGPLATNEEYDPVANTWATKTGMPTGRYGLAAVAVGGRVYAIGGHTGVSVATNEEYNPLTNTWTTKTLMPAARHYHAAAALNGRIYAIGGTGGTNVNEEYDPVANTWEIKTVMPTARYLLAAAAMGGKIYAIGGDGGTGEENQEYDPAANTWVSRANMPTARNGHVAAAVGGKIYAIGGNGGTNVNQEYDPGTAYAFMGLAPNTQYAFKAKARNVYGVETVESPSLSTYTLAAVGPAQGVSTFTAVYVSSLTVNWSSGSLAGGYNGPGAQYLVEASTVSVFAPITVSSLTYNIWAGLEGLTGNTTYYFRAKAANNLNVWGDYTVLGSTPMGAVGTPSFIYFDEVSTGAITAAVYAPTPAFSNLDVGISGVNMAKDGNYSGWRNGNMWKGKTAVPTGRSYLAAAAVNGRIYAIGGVSGLTANEEYNPAANTWAVKAAMPTARSGLAAAALSGKIYVVGGWNGAAAFNNNEEYDPAADTWTNKAVMPTARYYLAAAAVGGKIYAMGGLGPLSTNEEYDPVTNAWAVKTIMPTPRGYFAAAAVNGRIYAMGNSGGNKNVNEEYDPVTNTWEIKQALPTGRQGLAAAVVGGKIYTIGGYTGVATKTNEEYDPAANAWVARANMPIANYYLAAASAGGRVYAIGGVPTGTANQEYDPGTGSKFTGLTPNTQYLFKAKARNANGIETAESTEFSTYTLAAVGPAQGVGTFTDVYISSLAVNWSSGSVLGGYNGPGALYQVEASISSTTFLPLAASSQTYNIWAGLEGLTGSVTYYFRVKPRNNLGVWSDYLVLGSTVIGAIETPTNIYFDEVSTTAITAAAYAPTPAFSNLDIGASGINIAKDGVYAGWWSGNRWATKAVMTTARYNLAAAAVGGRIYAIGGYNVLTTNQEYNPVANTWVSKAAMTTGRDEFAAAAVNGKVYAIGGNGGLTTNQEYDPVANTWTTKAVIPTGRNRLGAAAANGKIYAIGGFTTVNVATNEEYDPVANTWTSKTSMPTTRSRLSVVAVNNRIYAIGGLGPLAANEEYDPVANTWAIKQVMPTARYEFAVAAVGGKIYAIGGSNGVILNQNQEYDPSANIWASRTNIPTPRHALTAAAVGGRIYTIGGVGGTNINEEYDPGTAYKFAGLTPNMQYAFKAKARNANGVETAESPELSTYTLAAVGPAQASTFTAVYVSSLTVNWSSGSAAGGYNGPGALYQVEASVSSTTFSPVTTSSLTYNVWADLEELTGSVTYYFRVKARNNLNVWGDYLVLGSTVIGSAQTPTMIYFDEVSTGSITAEVYAPTPAFMNLDVGVSGINISKNNVYAGWRSGNRWATKAVMTTGRNYLAAAAVNGKIYAIGGNSSLQTNEEYNPVVNSWTTKTNMTTGRNDLAAAALNGRVYAIGGTGGTTANQEYDPVTNAWVTKAVMPTARYSHAAAAVGGKIYAIGGNGPLATNEEYNPVTNIWAIKTVMPTARWYLAAAALNGRVYAIGGWSGSVTFNQNEEYNPVTNTWAIKQAMPTARWGIVAASVGGKIYAMGGVGPLAANEEYDPVADAWAARANMLTARYNHAAAAVGGRIYAIGGNGGIALNEEYDPGTAYRFNGLTPNTQYTFKAKARNANGIESAESPEVSTYTLAAVSWPQGVSTFTTVYVSSLTVNWSSGSVLGGYNGPGALYQVEASISSTTFLPLAASSQTYNIWAGLEGLAGSVTYYFRVKPRNNLGVWGDYLVLGSTVIGAIETPTNIYFDEVSTGSITAAAYTPTPGFSNLNIGASGMNIAKDGNYAGWWSGNRWATKQPMTTGRTDFAAAVVGGRIYAIGGSGGTNVNQEYNPITNTWATRAVMPTARTFIAAAAANGKIYVVGGAPALTANEEYDPVANTWTTKAVMPTGSGYLAAVAVNNRVYAIGGHNSSALATNQEYNPAVNAWAAKTLMPTARYRLAAAVMGGKIYALGGYSALSTNEEFDPVANTWMIKTAMSMGRHNLATASLGGKIYVIGGWNVSSLNQNEEYDPTSNTWASRAPMITGRDALVAASIGGRIYAIGGVNGTTTNEEYDPGTAYKFAGLTPNTQYTFKAKARNANGAETAESTSFSTYTLAAVGPAQGMGAFAAVYVSSLTVNWSSGSAAGGYNGAGALYQVEASVSSTTFSPITTSSQTYNLWGGLAGLSANTTYYFRAKAANSLGVWGDYIYISSGSTLAGPVVNPAIYAVHYTSAVFNWLPHPVSPSTATCEGYRVELSTAADFTGIISSSATPNVNLTTITISGLYSGGAYYVRVGSLNWDSRPNYNYVGIIERGNYDCGLRFHDGTGIVFAACEYPGIVSSKLRIGRGGLTYGVVLIDRADPNASKMVIQTPAGPKAIQKLP